MIHGRVEQTFRCFVSGHRFSDAVVFQFQLPL